MKSYFSLNHNPDAKDLKQLSIKTGLSKRVLQVRATWTLRAYALTSNTAIRLQKLNKNLNQNIFANSVTLICCCINLLQLHEQHPSMDKFRHTLDLRESMNQTVIR